MLRTVIALSVVLLTVPAAVVGQQPGTSTSQEETRSHRIIRLHKDDSIFDPASRKILSFRNPELVITLIRGAKNLAVEVQRTSGARGRIDLPSEIVQVNQITATQPGRAIVVGMVNGSVFQLVILNTDSITTSDTFLAYSPSVSPDGRFIAFVKFYPAHFVKGTDDHFLLYDVSRSPEENRSTNVGLNDHTNVGLPIYPLIPNHDGDNTGGPQQNQHHMLAQNFFWQSDSARYAFAEDYAGGWYLFIASTGGRMPVVRKMNVLRHQVCAPLRNDSCQATLADSELTPDYVVATFRGVGPDSAIQEVIQYRYEGFSPAN